MTFGFLVGSRNFAKLFWVSCEVFVSHEYDCIHCVAKSCTTTRHIDDCFATHFLHWEFCDPLWSSHQNYPLWARLNQWVFCKKPSLFSSWRRYHNLGPSESECRHHAYPRTWFHFCSRLHWKFMSWLGRVLTSLFWVSPRLCWSTFINRILSEFL